MLLFCSTCECHNFSITFAGHVYKYAYIQQHVHTCVYTCIQYIMYIYTYTRTYIYIYIYIYIHTYTLRMPRKLRRNWPPLRYIGYSRRDVTSLRITTQMRVTCYSTRVSTTQRNPIDPSVTLSFTSISNSIARNIFIHAASKLMCSFQIRRTTLLYILQAK